MENTFDPNLAKHIKDEMFDARVLGRKLVTEIINDGPKPLSWWKPYLTRDLHKSSSLSQFYLATLLRTIYIESVHFPIITLETFNELEKIMRGRKCVELGCGTGWLAANLRKHSIRIDCVDHYKSTYGSSEHDLRSLFVSDVINIDYVQLNLKPYEIVYMSWPDYHSDDAARVLENMHYGQVLIYQGESQYGCTASDAFFDILYDKECFVEVAELTINLNKHHVTFDGIHDNWSVMFCRNISSFEDIV